MLTEKGCVIVLSQWVSWEPRNEARARGRRQRGGRAVIAGHRKQHKALLTPCWVAEVPLLCCCVAVCASPRSRRHRRPTRWFQAPSSPVAYLDHARKVLIKVDYGNFIIQCLPSSLPSAFPSVFRIYPRKVFIYPFIPIPTLYNEYQCMGPLFTWLPHLGTPGVACGGW